MNDDNRTNETTTNDNNSKYDCATINSTTNRGFEYCHDADDENKHSDADDSSIVWWNQLVTFVQENGGYVHPGLVLMNIISQKPSTTKSTTSSCHSDSHEKEKVLNSGGNRGVYFLRRSTNTTIAATTTTAPSSSVTDIIRMGETLIRLPSKLSINGQKYPSTYSNNKTNALNNDNNVWRKEEKIAQQLRNTDDDALMNSQELESKAIATKAASKTMTTPSSTITDKSYPPPSVRRHASTWLRCLASYYDASAAIARVNSNNNDAFYCQQQNQVHRNDNNNNQPEKDGNDDCIGKINSKNNINDGSKINSNKNNPLLLDYLYMKSLPVSYETIWQWDYHEIDEFLSGTTSLSSSSYTSSVPKSSCWHVDMDVVRERYMQQVRPYLIQNCRYWNQIKNNTIGSKNKDSDASTTTHGNVVSEHEIQFFATACQALSTRCFHLESTISNGNDTVYNSDTDNNNDSTSEIVSQNLQQQQQTELSNIQRQQQPEQYSGPFLLPIIDLMNHTSDPSKKCTTLRRIVTEPGFAPSAPTSSSSEEVTNDKSDDDDVVNSDNYANNRITNIITDTEISDRNASDSQDDCSFFVMVAERTIQFGEEILHSYGNELTSSQFLQTFGFVPESYMLRAAAVPAGESLSSNRNAATDNLYSTLCATRRTPAIISKESILDACWDVIDSDIPQSIAKSMTERVSSSKCNKKDELDIDDDDDEDVVEETWSVSLDRTSLANADFIPDAIIISSNSTNEIKTLYDDDDDCIDSNTANSASCEIVPYHIVSCLSDELVTLCCIPFLPKCALDEVHPYELLNKCVLQDYYLGKLVCSALLRVVQTKLAFYKPISAELLSELKLTKNHYCSDEEILRDLLLVSGFISRRSNDMDKNDDFESGNDFVVGIKRMRLAYGLTIRIEEKSNIEMLRREILQILADLDNESAYHATDNKSNHDSVREYCDGEENECVKRLKTSSEADI